VRKESLGGVKDILSADVGREVGKVVRALGGLVSDDDAGVRKALVGFLAWYLPAIPEVSLDGSCLSRDR
jgi:pre-rRNA-processing protein IPI1